MKITKRTLFAAPVLGLAALLVSALPAPQDDAAAAEEAVATVPAAREVIDRYLDVTGVREFAPEYESQKSLGTIEIMGMGIKGTLEEYHMKPGLMRVNVELDMIGKVRSGNNGKIAWRIHPMMGEQILEGAEKEQLVRRGLPFDSVFKDPKGFEVIENLGEAEFEEQKCWRLRFVETPYEGMEPEETKAIREYFEYYAIDTGYLVGTIGVTASEMGEFAVTTTYGEYRKFGKVIAPTRSVVSMQGQKILAVIQMVEFNTVKEGVFVVPPEILELAKPAPAEGEGEGEVGDKPAPEDGEEEKKG